MKEWNYAFDAVTRVTWLEQIKKDLGTKTFDSIHSEWWPGETLEPVHHFEDLHHQIVALPDHFFIKPPLVMEWIDVSLTAQDAIHLKTINALTYGAQSIVFDFEENAQPDFENWLRDVYTDMIRISVNLSSGARFSPSNFAEQLPMDTVIRLQRGNEPLSKFLSPYFEIQTRNNFEFQFIYEIKSEGNWVKDVVSVFQKLLTDMTYWSTMGMHHDDFLRQCVLLFLPGKEYLKQIIQTRVLQIVWLNLKSELSNNTDKTHSPLECHIYPDGSSDPDLYLIRASSAALATSLTGAQSMCIHSIQDITLPGFYERINRNLHHLLELEGEMYKSRDPLSGSNSIDFYTKKWADQIRRLLPTF